MYIWEAVENRTKVEFLSCSLFACFAWFQAPPLRILQLAIKTEFIPRWSSGSALLTLGLSLCDRPLSVCILFMALTLFSLLFLLTLFMLVLAVLEDNRRQAIKNNNLGADFKFNQAPPGCVARSKLTTKVCVIHHILQSCFTV